MKLLELRAAPFQPNPMANVTVTWRSLTESLLSTAPKYDADGRMIVTFAGAEPIPIVASIVLHRAHHLSAPGNAKLDLSLKP